MHNDLITVFEIFDLLERTGQAIGIIDMTRDN